MPRQQILPGLDEHDPRDFDLASDPPIGIPGRPLVPHLFPEPTDGKAKRPFPGPTHVHVATLILDILADDIATQTIPGTMARLIGLDPDNRSSMEALPLGREPFLRDPEAPGTFSVRHSPSPEDMEHAMPFFRPDLVILQALKPQLAFNPLA